MIEIPTKTKSDLGVRTASAVVMVAVAGTALWFGSWWWVVFVITVAVGVLWEWWGLVNRFGNTSAETGFWLLVGIIYVGSACLMLVDMRVPGFLGSVNGMDECNPKRDSPFTDTALVITMTIAVDVGAYFFGRTFGGPKVAPKISPAKTWAGLLGGAFGAAIVFFVFDRLLDFFAEMDGYKIPEYCGKYEPLSLQVELSSAFFAGLFFATFAQSGDFFESWMKRKAGVKDSGKLIPGHGGLFDRVDGFIAVFFVLSVVTVVSWVF